MVDLVTPNESLAEAFGNGMPVLLLPPDWPADQEVSNARLLKLFMDVALRGSAGRVRIHRTVENHGKKEAS